MCLSRLNGGSKANVVLGWRVSASADLGACVAKVLEIFQLMRIWTGLKRFKPWNLMTFLPSRNNPFYPCLRVSTEPLNFRDVLLTIPNSSGDDKSKFVRVTAIQIGTKSLNIHFRFYYAVLRTKSLIFFGNVKMADLANSILFTRCYSSLLLPRIFCLRLSFH